MAQVTFLPPAKGAIAASIPVLIIAGVFRAVQNSTLFDTVNSNWSNIGMV